jgi:hypothetical protein
MESKGKICAFCSSPGRLTKEHVFPACFGRQSPDYVSRFSLPAGKLIGADHVIRDVCAECNNNRLSELDRWLCRFYANSLSHFPAPGQDVELKYKWDLLCRSILKVSYNAARSAKASSVPILANFRQWLLSPSDTPTKLPHLFLQVIRPHRQMRATVNGMVLQEVKPKVVRAGEMRLLHPEATDCCIRYVQINSYLFIILLAWVNMPRARRRRGANAFIQSRPGTVELRGDGPITVAVSPIDTFEVLEDHLSIHRDAYAATWDPADNTGWEDVA